MPSDVIGTGTDTWVGSGKPTATHGGDAYTRVSTGAAYGFVRLSNPAPRGSSIISAILRGYARGASTGSRTVTGKRVTEDWRVGRTHWDNQPAVTATGAASVGIGTLAEGDAVELDIAAQLTTMMALGVNHGWRIETTGAQHSFHSFEAGAWSWELEVEWSGKPSPPTTLKPSGGRLVSVAKPVVSFDAGELSGTVNLSAVKVQVDAAADGVTPDFDSGWVASTVPELDLAATAYAGLADGGTTQWRGKVEDSAGEESDWSDWASFGRDIKGTAAITNPAASPSNFVSEPTPPLTGTLTGETAERFQWTITPASNRQLTRWDSGEITGATIAATVPEKYNGANVLTDGSYSLRLRVWDAENRVVTSGDPDYVELWRDFTMADDAGVTAPASVVATVFGVTPMVDLTWTRGTAPDSFVILRDNAVIAADLLAADLLVSGTSYAYRDVTSKPYSSHVYKVKAVVNGVQSVAGTAAAVTPRPVGIWVIDVERDLSFMLDETEVDGWRMSDRVGVYRPLGSSVPMSITGALYGLDDMPLAGIVQTGPDVDAALVASMVADLWAIKSEPSRTVRLVTADLTIPVTLRHLSCTPSSEWFEGSPKYVVAATFSQTGEFPFEPVT